MRENLIINIFLKQQQHVTVLKVWRTTVQTYQNCSPVCDCREEAGVTHDSPSTGDHQFDFDPIGHQDTQDFLITHILHTAVKHKQNQSVGSLF